MHFRKDINGLRAIAVIAVVLFHFNASWVPGGFAGVDVFFVISGFLMTGIIFRKIEQDNFSILKFYVARANRIIPALAALCLVLLLFGWFYLLPMEYVALSKHVSSSMGFLSNIVYWRESGYFDASSHEKWLLHTWSLSAEWQFYIIYPLVLVALRKFMSVKALKATILLGTILGFIFCVIATYKWPNAAYYLLPTRAWEMMTGGVAYLYPLSIREYRKKYLEWFALTLIVGSYFLISKDNPWPGYLAIFPVLGSYLIIQAQCNDSFITGNIVFQKLGGWSYSIYLWHWPLVVAIYYFSLNEVFIYLGIATSILLGFLSSTYIEKMKFRNDFNSLLDYFKCKPVCMVILVGFLGGGIYLNKPSLSEHPSYFIGHKYPDGNGLMQASKTIVINHLNSTLEEVPEAILIGDSNSAHYTAGITFTKKMRIHHKWVGSCFAFENANRAPYADWMDKSWKNECYKLHEFTNSYPELPIIIAQSWSWEALDCNYSCSSETLAGYYEVLNEELEGIIKKVGKRKVFIIGQEPLPKISRRRCAFDLSSQFCNDPVVEFQGSRISDNYFLSHFSERFDNVFFLNPFNPICDDNSCLAHENGKNYFYDKNHLTALGSQKIWPSIEKDILEILNNSE